MSSIDEARLKEILARVHYQNRQEEAWRFLYEPVYLAGGEQAGWLLQGTFLRPETHTNVVDWGRTRKEFVALDASEDGVIKTCWVLIMLTEQHEGMESFMVDGIRVFDPHMPLRLLQDAERAAIDSNYR